MNSLEKALDEALKDSLYDAGARLIEEKLGRQGVVLTSRQYSKLKDHLRAGAVENFRIRTWRWWEKRTLKVAITPEEAQRFEDDFTAFLDEDLPDLVASVSDELADGIQKDLARQWSRESRRQDRDRRRFERRVRGIWGDAIGLLRQYLTVSRELGELANIHLRNQPDRDDPILVDVLARLHARGCQVTEEITCLLEAGLADGAIARWRTLHEIAAVALFLREHGKDLAERYVAHDAIESHHGAHEYQKLCEVAAYEPIPRVELQEIDDAYDAVLARYGPRFKSPYGWAADILRLDRPGILDISQAAGIDHLHSHYRAASYNVHSNPKGIFFKLGLIDESEVILAGASNLGLADPGQNTAISLMHVSSALLSVQPTVDLVVGLKILEKLLDQAKGAFIQAHEHVSSLQDSD